MNGTFALQSEGFRLSLDFHVFEADIAYPSNTTLSISVFSAGFSASASMDVDIKAVSEFCDELERLYATLKGEAKIYEPYGKQNICFSGDGYGHIFISGELHSNGENGFWQKLEFENSVDQTYIPDFLKEITRYVRQFQK